MVRREDAASDDTRRSSRRRDATEEQLERLADLRRDPPSTEVLVAALRDALRARSAQVVARAARLVEEQSLADLIEDLRAAFAERMQDPVRRDPQCVAKTAIVRALVTLEDGDAAIYLAASHHVQREPVWGGTQDTAAELRGLAALGLLETSLPDLTFELVRLLHDPEAQTRILATRAMGGSSDPASEAVLRFKVLSGDAERDVTFEALAALLERAPGRSLPFVGSLIAGETPAGQDTERAEAAALVLGESRLEDAFPYLERAWQEGRLDHGILAMALSASRREPALSLLLDVVTEGSRAQAREALRALLLHRDDEALAERVRVAVELRGDGELASVYRPGAR